MLHNHQKSINSSSFYSRTEEAAVEDPEWESLSYSASSLFASKSPIHIFRLELVHALAQGATININPLFFSIGLAHPFFCSYQEHTQTHRQTRSVSFLRTQTHIQQSRVTCQSSHCSRRQERGQKTKFSTRARKINQTIFHSNCFQMSCLSAQWGVKTVKW